MFALSWTGAPAPGLAGGEHGGASRWGRSDLIDNGMGRSIGARLVGMIFPLLAQSTAGGALPTLYAATAPEAESGTYYGP